MKRTFLWSIPVVIVIALAALYFWPQDNKSQPQPVPPPAPEAEPAIRYPVEPAELAPESLPPLAESDSVIGDALIALFGQGLHKLVYLKDIVHRVVATVDNLPQDHLSQRLMPLKPVGKAPIVKSAGENFVFSPKNSARYARYLRLVDAVPTDALVALYARFYPLFQQQYEDLGHPDQYFNDRAVQVIDHLLGTPAVEEPPVLIQPGVLYEFSDPKLESLSAGQKLLIRIGAANAAKVKSKLREIREALVSMAPPK